MADGVALYRVYELPWSAAVDQERRFWRIFAGSVLVMAVLSLVFPLLPVQEHDSTQVREIPQRFARLVVEKPVPPPPPPVVREEPELEPEPERVVEREVEPEPPPELAPEPEDTTERARGRARVAGLLPFAAELASLVDENVEERLDQADVLGAGEGDVPLVERSLITSRAGTGSGGINTAALSRNTGGSGLAGRLTTRVDSPVEGLDGAGRAAQRNGTSNKASRSREEIERIFDRNKGAIYSLYNRALRENPGLEGNVVLRLTIAPDGAVTACEVISSELGDPGFEHKLVQRVLLFKFEAKDVEAITTTKPIDFFPA